MKNILLCLILWMAVLPAQADPFYWIAIGDTTGYTVQNVWIDFDTPDQQQGVGRIALNSVVLRDGLLVRPQSVQTLTVDLSPGDAQLVIGATIINLTLAEALVREIAQFAVADTAVGLPDSVTVKKTEGGATTAIQGYGR